MYRSADYYLLTYQLLYFSAMLTAMFAALAVLTPPGFEAPASRSVVRLGVVYGAQSSSTHDYVKDLVPERVPEQP